MNEVKQLKQFYQIDQILESILEAYDLTCHSGVEYYICCICVGYSTHHVFSAVSFVCQTSTMVIAVSAVSYYLVYMWHVVVSHYVLC
jgi:hypothetical protein